jgi:acetyl esterase/lipase
MPSPDVEDIRYRSIDGIDLLARLYRPAGEGGPFVVDVHGGAWISGDRLNHAVIHEDLAAHGIGVFAVDFRLATEARFPAPVDDVNYAIRWFKANAGTLGLAPALIGGLAASSGAQQLGLVALQPTVAAYTTADPALADVDASVAFFVACWPILDPLARYRMVREKGNERLVGAHDAYFADEDAMTMGNPYLVLERGEATHLPPMMIIQGTADQNVAPERADQFAERYRAAGGAIEVHKFADQPHTFIPADPTTSAAKQAIALIRDFVLAREG